MNVIRLDIEICKKNIESSFMDTPTPTSREEAWIFDEDIQENIFLKINIIYTRIMITRRGIEI